MSSKLKSIIYVIAFLLGLTLASSASAAITIRPMLNTGLVGYWSMDEGTGEVARDQSGYRNNGTLTQMDSTTDWVNGRLGGALNFDGSDDHVDAGDLASLDMGLSDMTISVWINPSVSGTFDDQIVNKKNGPFSLGYDFRYDHSSDMVCARLGSAGTSSACSLGVVPTNVWTHVAASMDRDGYLTIYVNGAVSGSPVLITSDSGENQSNGDSFSIGCRNVSGTCDVKTFLGEIDEVRLYNRVLSAQEITRLYNLTKPKLLSANTTGLVGYWSFDEGTGSIAGDMSGRGNNGTTTSGQSWVNGKRGEALNFNGSSDAIIISDTNDKMDAASAITVSVWFYPHNLNVNWRGVVIKGGATAETNYYLGYDWNKFAITFTSAGWRNHYSVNTYAPNNWYHLVGVIDNANNNVRLYVNGILDIDSQNETNDMTANNGPFYIGRDVENNNWTDGVIDEVRVYNRALSATEVASLYGASKKIIKLNTSQNLKLTDGLVGLWSFNGPDIYGATAFDRSDSGNNGAITGATIINGKVGQALYFNGSSNYVNLNSINQIPDKQVPITISTWMNLRNGGGGGKVVSRWDDNGGYYSWLFSVSSGAGLFYVSTSPSNQLWLATTSPLSDDTWYNIVGVYSGGTDVKVYLNGSLSGTGVDGGWACSSSGGSVTIGAGQNGGSRVNHFNGSIDEVRIYSRALSAGEIKRLYNMGK